ncbi:hypothetical protein Hdeb2414_s0047g00748001 [Helianthus debilis subsp. tardiflorus]
MVCDSEVFVGQESNIGIFSKKKRCVQVLCQQIQDVWLRLMGLQYRMVSWVYLHWQIFRLRLSGGLRFAGDILWAWLHGFGQTGD